MHYYLCVSMPYGPFFGDTDFPLRAACPSSGEQPGALRCRAGTWSETGRKPFSFFTLNTAASGVHTKRDTSSSPESRKLNKLTAWGPPQVCFSSGHQGPSLLGGDFWAETWMKRQPWEDLGDKPSRQESLSSPFGLEFPYLYRGGWLYLFPPRVPIENKWYHSFNIHWAPTVHPPYPWVPHPQIQPTADGKYSKKKMPENSKKQNLHLPYSSNDLHSIYIVFTTIYIAFTLY